MGVICTQLECGKPVKSRGLCSMHYERLRMGRDLSTLPNPNRGSGRSLTSDGYVRLHLPSHPLAQSYGWVLEHRLVAWEHGVPIGKLDHVHHRDENKLNNDWSNLVVLTASEHGRIHHAIPRQEVGRLYLAGLSTIEVAERLDTYPGNISRILRLIGVSARPAGRRYK